MNKITVDLSQLQSKDGLSDYVEIEIKMPNGLIYHFPKTIFHSSYNTAYDYKDAIDSRGNTLCRYNNGIKNVSGEFEFIPLTTDGILYKVIKEVKV